MKLDTWPAWAKPLCIAYISLITGVTLASVGHSTPPATYGLRIVPTMFVLVALPAALAYMAGRRDGSKKS